MNAAELTIKDFNEVAEKGYAVCLVEKMNNFGGLTLHVNEIVDSNLTLKEAEDKCVKYMSEDKSERPECLGETAYAILKPITLYHEPSSANRAFDGDIYDL